MSIGSVAPAVAFGARTTARDPFQFIDDHSLLYISGGNLVHFTLSSRTQKFTPATTREAVITALNVTRERHYLAIAERIPARATSTVNASTVSSATGGAAVASDASGLARKGRDGSASVVASGNSGVGGTASAGLSSAMTTMRSVVHIFGLPTYRKRKTLSLDEVYPFVDKRPKEVAGISFSSDSKNVAVLTSDLFLTYWTWEKARNLGATIIPVSQRPSSAHHSGGTSPHPPAVGGAGRGRIWHATPTASLPLGSGTVPPATGATAAAPPFPTQLAVSVNPSDDELIAVHAQGFLRIYRASEGALKPVPLQLPVKESEVTSFTWISAARFAIGARSCIVILENTAFKAFYILESAASSGHTVPAASSPPAPSPGMDEPSRTSTPLSGGAGPPALAHGLVTSSANAIMSLTHFPPELPAAGPLHYPPVDALSTSSRLLVASCKGTVHVYERNSRDAADLIKLVCRSPILVENSPGSTGLVAQGNGGLASGASGMQHAQPPGASGGEAHDGKPGAGGLMTPLRNRSLVVNSSEELMLVVGEDGACILVNVSMIELAKGEALQCTPVLPSFHSGAITGMDVCARKPITVTCSTDKSIRIWNFANYSCELFKSFPEEPLSVSIHPSGYYLLAGFPDKLRLFTILPDDLRTLHEFPIRGCRDCAFARGGHQFAAVQGSIITVYNVWTFELIATLKAHNGRIRSLYWTRGTHVLGNQTAPSAALGGVDLDDARLVSCGADGAVYSWVLRDPASLGLVGTTSKASQAGKGPTGSGGEATGRRRASMTTAQQQQQQQQQQLQQHLQAPGTMVAKRVNEYIQKGVCFTSAIDVAGITFAVGTDRTLRAVADSLLSRELRSPLVDVVQLAASQSGRMFFVATGAGTIKAVRSPLPADVSDLDADDVMQEHAAHATAVARMKVTSDDKFLVSVGEDACVVVFRIWDRESATRAAAVAAATEALATAGTGAPATSVATGGTGTAAEETAVPGGTSRAGSPLSPPAQVTFTAGQTQQQSQPQTQGALGAGGTLPPGVDSVYADEVVVTKSDLEEKTVLINEMRTRLEELKIEQDYQLRLKDMYLQDKLKELTLELTKEIEALKSQSVVLRSEKDKDEAKHKDEYQLLVTRSARELRETENHNNQQLMNEYERFQTLQEEMRAKQHQWEAEHAEFERQRTEEIGKLTAHFEDLLRGRADALVQLHELMDQQVREFTEDQRQHAEDIETEVATQEARYEQALKHEREVSFRLKGENGIMKKKFLTLNKEIEDNKIEVAKLRDNESRLRKILAALEREVDLLKADMLERDRTIQEQERRVYDLKKSNQELEKYKFVLDHKIKDLKQQIEPREQAIDEFKARILATNKALSDQNEHEQAMLKAERDLREALAKANQDAALAHQRTQALVHMLKQCQTDVTLAIEYIQDPALLAKSVAGLQTKYCKGMPKAQAKQVTDMDVELDKQEAALRKTIRQLKQHLEKQSGEFRIEHFAQVQENKGLIAEVRRLRAMRESLPVIRASNNNNNITVSQSSMNAVEPAGSLSSIVT